MKSPLMDNTDEQISNESAMTNKSISKIGNEIKEKFIRTSSVLRNQSISTQTSVNYTILSPMSMHNLNSTSIQSAILCRICYNSELKESLLQPCNCSGTMGLIHRTCLERWLSQCVKNQCEICGYDYNVERTNRPFSAWICRPITTKDTKNLLNDLLCFLILTPLAFISTWYCVGFAFKFHESESVNKWESSGLVILTTFLVIIYVLWITFSIRYHYKVFLDWQDKNQIVKVNVENTKVLLNSNLMSMKIENESRLQSKGSPDSINQTIDTNDQSTANGIELVENPMYVEHIAGSRRKSIYKKNTNAEFKVESCVIEV